MNLKLKSTLAIAAMVLGTQAMAQVTFYEGEGFRGRAFTTDKRIGDFARFGFNDRARSVVVDSGRWEVCEDSRFEGRCVVLRRGSYDSLQRMGLTDSISSVRPLERNRPVPQAVVAPEPLPAPTYEYRRRANERVYEAPITSVRAVVGPPNQRCWMERQQVQQAPSQNVGGALLGGLIGGVLGHQVGGGSGKDLATVAGAVGGAVVGNNMAGGGSVGPVGRDVQRCETTQSTTPEFWDVTYNYRGAEHHVQMSAPPTGNTIFVNANGLPRQ